MIARWFFLDEYEQKLLDLNFILEVSNHSYMELVINFEKERTGQQEEFFISAN
jgi:hypothetical protein